MLMTLLKVRKPRESPGASCGSTIRMCRVLCVETRMIGSTSRLATFRQPTRSLVRLMCCPHWLMQSGRVRTSGHHRRTRSWFHSAKACLPIQTQLVDILEHATASDWAFSSLPAFDRIIFRQRRCQYAAKFLQAQSTRARVGCKTPPPSLLQLAEDAAFRTLLSHPPPCVDPIDCVVDASLYDTATDTVVLENVLCFLKFDRVCLQANVYNSDWGNYVNPVMLETLTQVALAADPFRPRLLVFVKEGWTPPLSVQRECLPTTFPSVVVSRRLSS